MGVRVTQGATVVREPDDELAAVASKSADPTDAYSVATTQRLHSLTAGATYTVTAYYRSTNTNVRAWFDNTFLQITPQY
jgi:non-ribosomal peptide synthetase component E (peptide arylation enzyme)